MSRCAACNNILQDYELYDRDPAVNGLCLTCSGEAFKRYNYTADKDYQFGWSGSDDSKGSGSD